MEKTLTLKLITPAKTVFEQEVEQVILPTEAGEITVLPKHTYLVSILKPGEMLVTADGKESPVAVAGGVIEMYDNTLVILADSAEHPTEINVEEAEKRAEELAREIEQQTDMDLNTYNTLQHSLAHEQARLRTGKKWRK